MGYRKIVQADKNTTRKSLSKEEASDFFHASADEAGTELLNVFPCVLKLNWGNVLLARNNAQ